MIDGLLAEARFGLDDIEERLAPIREAVKEMNETVTASLRKIEKNVEDIMKALRTEAAKSEARGFEPNILLDFPDHLRVTIRALLELGMATADEVSKKTGRSRSLESTYLNNLTTMGYVEKGRGGQLVYYRIRFDRARRIVGE